MIDVEPLIRHELSESDPLPASLNDDWQDVLGRVHWPNRRWWRQPRRRMLVAGLLAMLLATGIALAAGVNPFAGIGAAGHAQTPEDVLEPAVLAQINSYNNANGTFSPGRLVPKSSRLLGQLTSGRNIYVTTTTKDVLCILVTHPGKLELVSCHNPLTQANPITLGSFNRVKNGPNATLPISYGIAKDGITAVSFTAHGREKTVPVNNNVWFYEGHSNILRSITIHYADGRTRTLTH